MRLRVADALASIRASWSLSLTGLFDIYKLDEFIHSFAI
jgi:hypothetical protein